MHLFHGSKEDVRTCEIVAIDLVGSIWNDSYKLQSLIPVGIHFEPEKYFVDEVIFQTHLLQMIVAKLSPKGATIILEAIEKHGLGGVERYSLKSFPDLPLDLRRLLVKRGKQYRQFEFPSVFTTNDYPGPDMFSFSAGMYFNDPELLDRCLTMKKRRAETIYAEFVELLYSIN